MDIFSESIKSGDLLRAETYQNILNFLKGSHVGGGSVSPAGIVIPSDNTRNPRIVRFVAEENIQSYTIIELTEQITDEGQLDNQVPTFKAKPASGTGGTLFYTESSHAEAGGSGMAFTIGGEPILIRSEAAADGIPGEGRIVEQAGGTFRYLGESDTSDAKWFLPLLGGSGEPAPVNAKVRLVQPKELFPACEYKTLQDVYGCILEYSDDGTNWKEAQKFDIVGGRVVHDFQMPDESKKPHQYWQFNLKGFGKPDDPENEHADRGFYTFGRLWKILFWIERSIESKQTIDNIEYTFSVHVPHHWLVGDLIPPAITVMLDPPVSGGELFYRPDSGEWISQGSFESEQAVFIPIADYNHHPTFHFKVESEGHTCGFGSLRKPTYTLSPEDAVMTMPMPEGESEKRTCWDSKPIPRKAQNHRHWTLAFDEPEVVAKIMVDADQHTEHYIICPGGRDAFKQDVPFIYAFDLACEQWTATTFPQLQKPMYNMDAKIVEIADKTHQLIILSGQIASGFSNIIQGYNFEKDYLQNIVDMGDGAINFAGRPALMGNPMVRSGFNIKYPDGENDFSKSLIVVGGAAKSVYLRGTTSAIDSSLFFIQGSTLNLGFPYEVQSLNINVSNVGNTGLPFGSFNFTTNYSQAGAVGTRFLNTAKYVRHQNLPVRGILRRRPNNTNTASASNPAADFLLIGGFNPVGRVDYNKSVVSGIFGNPTASQGNSAWYSMWIKRTQEQSGQDSFYANNDDYFLTYPDSPYVLGDCCAEYVADRDEVICFGGRANETDTAVAHVSPLVLQFDPASNGATWVAEKYPPMPHPRWSAASVLIKDFVRQGEVEAADRIFIIGGRNREGFVPEVDVFNLNTNQWETDWKGLDQGELEEYTAPGSTGGTTIIVAGGSSGIQSIKAGEGIFITGDSKNVVISAAGLTWE